MRRRRAEKREILGDPKYHNRLVAKFINSLMFDGKKNISECIVYGAFNILEKKTENNTALKVFNKAIDKHG